MSSAKPESRSNNPLYTYGARVLLNAAAHPFEYAKVLIQIGHEPISPSPTTTFLGKPALKLPNIFEYVKYIKSVDGFTGCYRGIVPKVCGNIVGVVTSSKIARKYDKLEKHSEELDDPDNLLDSMNSREKFICNVKRDIVCRVSSIVVSHPFHVITVRIMAQFVGSESTYSGLFGSIAEIYRQNGIMGFFAGLIPRVLGDVLYTVLAASLTYALNTYVCQESEIQTYTSTTMTFLASAITYPFQVVSNCMAITGSGLAAGAPPNMPLYTSWFDCWFDLSQKGQLKRGSSLLIRYYAGPHLVIAGKPVPIPHGTSGNIMTGTKLKY